MANELVSVIVPVYNTFDYVDKCIESILNQTYRNIELILINDGSTDGKTGDKCYEWSKKDSRIIFISKKNEHLGPTRNVGIDMARGKYVTFVDSDDWIDVTFVEKMLRKLCDTQADIACCGFYEANKYNKVEREIFGTGKHVVKYTNNIMNLAPWCMHMKMYRMDIFTRSGFREIDNIPEDIEIVPKLIAFAEKIVYLQEPLYYYYSSRPGNDSTSGVQIKGNITAFELLIGYFKKNALFDKYYFQLKRILTSVYVSVVNQVREFYSDEEASEIISEYTSFMKEVFIDWDDKPLVTLFGSYNLRLEMAAFDRRWSENLFRYMYSSVVSVMSSETDIACKESAGRDKFKRHQAINDINKEFVKSHIDKCNDGYLLIDFLEETYDLILNDKNDAITYSDICKELLTDNIEGYRVVERFTDEYIMLWHEKCNEFAKFLRENWAADKIILVRNYLNPYYGKYRDKVKFDNYERINVVNAVLRDMYSYFEKMMPDIHIIDEFQDDLQYASCDANGKYDCKFANDIYYHRVADKFESIIRGKENENCYS